MFGFSKFFKISTFVFNSYRFGTTSIMTEMSFLGVYVLIFQIDHLTHSLHIVYIHVLHCTLKRNGVETIFTQKLIVKITIIYKEKQH